VDLAVSSTSNSRSHIHHCALVWFVVGKHKKWAQQWERSSSSRIIGSKSKRLSLKVWSVLTAIYNTHPFVVFPALGGFSHVFLVKDVKTGEEYAMKRMLVDEGERLDNADAEIKIMENLPPCRYLLKLLAWEIRPSADMYEVLMLLEYCSGAFRVERMISICF
jgi:hypothetical protein